MNKYSGSVFARNENTSSVFTILELKRVYCLVNVNNVRLLQILVISEYSYIMKFAKQKGNNFKPMKNV